MITDGAELRQNFRIFQCHLRAVGESAGADFFQLRTFFKLQSPEPDAVGESQPVDGLCGCGNRQMFYTLAVDKRADIDAIQVFGKNDLLQIGTVRKGFVIDKGDAVGNPYFFQAGAECEC